MCLRVLATCRNLIICYLQYNKIATSDLASYLAKFDKLQKLDLSFNMIKKLPSGQTFLSLKNLKIFYLHDNLISQWNDLNSISEAPVIMHLTMMRNPISQVPGYRHQLVNHMQSLLALDEYIVTDEEKIQYLSPNAIRFRAMSMQFMKIHVPKFLENLSAEKHLFNLEVDIYRIKRMFERNSPSIRIQSLYRGYDYRSKAVFSYAQKKQAAIRIQKVARGWLYRRKIKKELQMLLKQNDMDYLLMSQDQYRQYRAVIKIEKAAHGWIRKKRKQRLYNQSATMIQKFWKGKYTKYNSFMRGLGVENADCCIYFLKEQKAEFYKILVDLIKSNKEIKQIYALDDLKRYIVNDVNFSLIRYPNPLNFKRQEFPLLSLTMPTYACRVRVSKGFTKLIAGGQHVYNVYTRFSGMEREKAILDRIKIRMCHYNAVDTSIIFNTRQSKNSTIRAKKLFDNYQELLVFRPNSTELVRAVCQAIFKNNQDIINENFLAFFPTLMRKVSAAISIQQSFRSYLIRREQKIGMLSNKRLLCHPAIEYCFSWAVIEQRAVFCISQWWKYFKLKRRLEALTSIHQFIKTINHPCIYMEESIYLSIEKILARATHQFRFMDQSINFDFYHPSLAQPNMTFSQRKILIQDNESSTMKETSRSDDGMDDLGYHLVIQNINDLNDRFRDHPFPLWMERFMPDFNKFIYKESNETQFFNSYLGIIHKSTIDLMSVVKDYNEIVSHHDKQLSLNNGLSFVQINCCSVTEAKKRALVIALLSYNMKKKNFIKLFTQQGLSDGIFLKSLYQLWDQYGIEGGDARMKRLLANSGGHDSHNQRTINPNQIKLQLQKHTGVVLNLKDRWEIEGHQIMRFNHIKKTKEIPSYHTTKQRKHDLDNVEYIYLQRMPEEDTLKLEINIQDVAAEPSMISNPKQQSEASLILNPHSQRKQSFYHVSSKEPTSALKNISLKDIQQQSKRSSNQYIINDGMSVPNSTKSVTAWPSSRYYKAQVDQNKNNLNQTGKNVSQGSTINFFSMRHSSNVASTRLNSQEQTPLNRYEKGVKKQSGTQSLQYSAFVTRGHSRQKSMIGEQDNNKLLEMSKQEEEQKREYYKQTQKFEKQGKRFEVEKIKQINMIMKQIVRVEQDANIQMYQRFNKQEKELISEIREKEKEKFDKEKQDKRQAVLELHEKQDKIKQERNFSTEFNQIRNLITKQSRIGQIMKLKNRMQKGNKDKVKEQKEQEKEALKTKSSKISQQKLKPLTSTEFDLSAINQRQSKAYQRLPKTAVHSPRPKEFSNDKQVFNNSSHNLLENNPSVPQRFQIQLDGNGNHQYINQNKAGQDAIIDYDLIENKLFEFGFKQHTKNNLIKYRQAHKLTFIEENYPISLSSSIFDFQKLQQI
ncbi:leucine-rich repeat and iq domain-containing protein 3 [Stylonychia lemnae]|uniref:Leucine-rich repeat and iq domain-containing protein 3 n=1 Tax=Stylonychia lemnae TaxID=5949 RepID=A0A078ANK1_STYLE|nr:leucine-rich repeat and iq domain-containing protein 3 [Stylonychia lemnae]|eukprot:CDW83920.1 leucine-rich repeat and iq domain-containing protein 3 [Stylonychia lemnae]